MIDRWVGNVAEVDALEPEKAPRQQPGHHKKHECQRDL
jgi:hypothetical protein